MGSSTQMGGDLHDCCIVIGIDDHHFIFPYSRMDLSLVRVFFGYKPIIREHVWFWIAAMTETEHALWKRFVKVCQRTCVHDVVFIGIDHPSISLARANVQNPDCSDLYRNQCLAKPAKTYDMCTRATL
jgi:hypothetical protein